MSKDKIEVNMNVYDIPILVEALEEANKEIKRLKEEYVMLQNASDEVEEKDKEIERLNNIINKGIEAINVYQNGETLSIGYEDLKRIRGILQGNEFDLRMFEEYLQELEGVDKEIYLKTPENYDYIMTLIENNKKLGKELEYFKNKSSRQMVEIGRLNNIINEFEKWLDEKIKEYRFYDEHDKADTLDIASYKLQELKGDDKE